MSPARLKIVTEKLFGDKSYLIYGFTGVGILLPTRIDMP